MCYWEKLLLIFQIVVIFTSPIYFFVVMFKNLNSRINIFSMGFLAQFDGAALF